MKDLAGVNRVEQITGYKMIPIVYVLGMQTFVGRRAFSNGERGHKRVLDLAICHDKLSVFLLTLFQ